MILNWCVCVCAFVAFTIVYTGFTTNSANPFDELCIESLSFMHMLSITIAWAYLHASLLATLLPLFLRHLYSLSMDFQLKNLLCNFTCGWQSFKFLSSYVNKSMPNDDLVVFLCVCVCEYFHFFWAYSVEWIRAVKNEHEKDVFSFYCFLPFQIVWNI